MKMSKYEVEQVKERIREMQEIRWRRRYKALRHNHEGRITFLLRRVAFSCMMTDWRHGSSVAWQATL